MPDCPGDIEIEKLDHHPGMLSRTYDIEVITPMFGGGVDAGKIDPEHPIRESSIRGHLRFWWRATRGASFSDVRELRQREGEIWGSTENPSPVILYSTLMQPVEPKNCGRYEWNQNRRRGAGGYDLHWWNGQKHLDKPAFLYTLFPYQGKAPDSPDPSDPSKTIVATKFSLIVKSPTPEKMSGVRSKYNEQRNKENERRKKENEKRLVSNKNSLPYLPLLNEEHDDILKDIEAAIWAWVNFGGIGARTRRGCGALLCTNVNPLLDSGLSYIPKKSDVDELFKWYTSSLDYFGLTPLQSSISRNWPTIPRQIFFKSPKPGDRKGSDSVSKWYEAVEVLYKFRQGIGFGRDPGPGLSRWPEAEALREYVYGTARVPKSIHRIRPRFIHGVDPRMSGFIKEPNLAFPRVEFGMPIILEIRKEGIKPTLQPSEENDRMASPLLLRCIKCEDGMCASMIFRFNTLSLRSAYVKPGDPDKDDNTQNARVIPQAEIQNLSSTGYPNSPMAKRCTNGSALDAFLSFAEKESGFMRVG